MWKEKGGEKGKRDRGEDVETEGVAEFIVRGQIWLYNIGVSQEKPIDDNEREIKIVSQ